MAERRKARVFTAVWIRRRWSLRRPWRSPDAAGALVALLHAWITTVVASLLLISALAASPLWDGRVFRHALCDALTSDPELPAQPTDDFPATNPAEHDN